MSRSLSGIVGIVVVAGLLLIAGVRFGPWPSQGRNENRPIRLAYQNRIGSAACIVAVEKGALRTAGRARRGIRLQQRTRLRRVLVLGIGRYWHHGRCDSSHYHVAQRPPSHSGQSRCGGASSSPGHSWRLVDSLSKGPCGQDAGSQEGYVHVRRAARLAGGKPGRAGLRSDSGHAAGRDARRPGSRIDRYLRCQRTDPFPGRNPRCQRAGDPRRVGATSTRFSSWPGTIC